MNKKLMKFIEDNNLEVQPILENLDIKDFEEGDGKWQDEKIVLNITYSDNTMGKIIWNTSNELYFINKVIKGENKTLFRNW